MGKNEEKGNLSVVEQLTRKLTQEIERQHSATSKIKREGYELIIPKFMSTKDAIKALTQMEKDMETPASKLIQVKGHTNETLAAFFYAMKNTFGNILGVGDVIGTFFGPMMVPSISRTIEVGYGETLTVPFGKVQVPGMPIELFIEFKDGYGIDDNVEVQAQERVLLIKASYLKKFEPLVEDIERQVKLEIKTNSIFKGKAIDSRYKFLNLKGFPIEKIAYGAEETRQLNANLFTIIENAAAAKAIGVSMKRTILLSGPFGTGKTLTALLTANKAVANGWTFVHVLPGDDIGVAIEFAKRFEPAVVFFEDIDSELDGERDKGVNGILNTIDGMLSKNAKVLCILTTNNADKIERAMLRPGRIDKVIELGKLDELQLKNLIDVYVGPRLEGPVDYAKLLGEAGGYSPAYIAESCQQAMLYALVRMGSPKDLKITEDDLIGSMRGLRAQYDLMMKDRKPKVVTMDQKIAEAVAEATTPIAEGVVKIVRHIGE